MDNYTADMVKYASPSETAKIRACYQSFPVQLAKGNKKFQYKIVQRVGTAAIFGAPICPGQAICLWDHDGKLCGPAGCRIGTAPLLLGK